MGTERRSCPVCGAVGGSRLWETDDASAVRCARCGTGYLDQRTARAAATAADTYERVYARPARLDPLTVRSYEAVLERFARYRRSRRIVDIGCGAGGFIAVAARHGWEAMGTEAAPGAGELARAAGATVLIGERALDAIEDASADVVTLWEVVEHVDDPVGLLAGSRRILRPGGLVYLTTPNFGSLQRRLLGRRWPRFHLEHETYFDGRTIELAVARAGLRKVRVVTKNFDPFEIASGLLPPAAAGPADAVCRDVDPSRSGWVGSGRQQLRAFAKVTPVGRVVARWLDRVLGATGLGDTLVAEAERPA